MGSHIAEHFAGRDEDVMIVDNFSREETLGKGSLSASHNWKELHASYPGLNLLKADLRHPETLERAGRGFDVIFHAAAQVAVTTSVANPRMDFEINTLGTLNVLEAARTNDSAVVFCSTNKVYGENVNAIPIKEESRRYAFSDPAYVNGIPEKLSIDHTSHSPYGSSKLAADIYVQEYAHTYGLRTGIFRMSCIYGERQFGVEDQGWVAWFTIATLTGKPITIYGDGKQVRDVLYVKDLIDAFDRFIKSKLRHEVFNMGGGPSNTLSLLELIELLKELTGKEPRIRHAGWRPADQKVYISDTRKAKAKLGWTPCISPNVGARRLVDWVNRNLKLLT